MTCILCYITGFSACTVSVWCAVMLDINGVL